MVAAGFMPANEVDVGQTLPKKIMGINKEKTEW